MCWNERSLETKLSDGNEPPGSEKSVMSFQNASSLSWAGSSSADQAMPKNRQKPRSATTTRCRLVDMVQPFCEKTLVTSRGNSRNAPNFAFHFRLEAGVAIKRHQLTAVDSI